MARNQPKSPFVWAILGDIQDSGGNTDAVIRCKETTRKFLGLRVASSRFIGERVSGTKYRAMRGGAYGENYTLILDKPRNVGGVRLKTMGLTVPASVTVNELVLWLNRNAGKVDALVTPRGVRHSTVTDLGDRVADALNDGADLVGDLIPNFGENFSDGLENFGNFADRLIPDNPAGLISDVAGLVGLARQLPGVP
ncbi:MAG: hypothetical protein ACFB0C_20880 [Leptolyngbyaceae cyanobacterium]|mgnify:CR=1 FL=1